MQGGPFCPCNLSGITRRIPKFNSSEISSRTCCLLIVWYCNLHGLQRARRQTRSHGLPRTCIYCERGYTWRNWLCIWFEIEANPRISGLTSQWYGFQYGKGKRSWGSREQDGMPTHWNRTETCSYTIGECVTETENLTDWSSQPQI